MPDKQVTMTLKATDGASKVFKAVGQSGDAMGKQIAQSAETASRGLEQMDQSASRAGQGLGQYRDNLQQVGLGIGALGGLLAVSGQSFRDQEVQLEALRRGYGDAADDLIQYTEALQDTTNFSNDAGVAAANIFRTLSENYGFTADQIQQLITVSADLAASQGIGLADAAMRVQSAMRGEAESAEYLGLTLNDSALGIDRLSMSVGQNERAQIRFIALQDQASFAMGTAQQQAEGTYGTMTNLKDSINDNAQSLGQFLGPFGEIGAFAADNAVQVGLLSLAVGQMGKGIGAIGGIASTMGLSLGSLFGPAGLAIAGVGLAGAAFLKFSGILSKDVPAASTASEESLTSLLDVITRLGDAGELQGSKSVLAMMLTDMTADTERIDTLLDMNNRDMQMRLDEGVKMMTDWNLDMLDIKDEGLNNLFSEEELAWIDGLKDGLDDGKISMEELTYAAGAFGPMLSQAQNEAEGFKAAMSDIQAILSADGAGTQYAVDGVIQLITALNNGSITAETFTDAVHTLYTDMQQTQAEAAAQAQEVTTIYEGQRDGIMEVTAANKDYVESAKQQAAADQFLATINEIATEAVAGRMSMTQLITDAQKEETAAAILAAQAVREKAASDELGAEAAGKFAAMTKAAAEAEKERVLAAQARPSDGAYASLVKQADDAAKEIQDRFLEAYKAIATPPQALENGFRVIVGNTNAIADSADSVAKWAAEMTDAAEGMSKLDSILDANSAGLSAATINQEEYNAAQEAFRDIQRENAEIAQDVAVIQAKQAPILAELMAGTENYMQKIAEMDGIQQTAALGFMDSAESAQALQLQMLALDAASGALGTNGRQWASGIIEGAAMADPVLKAMLLDMGLISEGADGTITVNFDDNATSPLQQIVAAVQELNETTLLLVAILDDDPFTNTAKDVEDKMNSIGEMEQYPIVGVNDQTDTPLRKIITNMAVVGNITETPTVNLQDNASGGLANVKNLLDSLYDKTIYVNTVGTVSGSFGPQLADGGVIPQAAHGRAIKGKAIVGEAGWEMIDAPGGFVTPHTASVQDMKAKSGININLTIEGNIYGVDDLVSQVVDVVTPALGRALDIQRRSLSA